MARFPDPWNDYPIEYLAQLRFPALGLSPAEVAKISPLEFEKLTEGAALYRRELEALDHEQLQQRIEAGKLLEGQLRKARAEATEAARFYNQPAAQADFSYWSRISFWTLDEAVALSFGKDPRIVRWKNIEPITNISSFAKEYSARRVMVERAKISGQLWESTYPNLFLAWAERMRFEMPTALIDAVKALGIQIADWKTIYDKQTEIWQSKFIDQQNTILDLTTMNELLHEKTNLIASQPVKESERTITTRERDSLLKLVIGMAIKGYGYDPKATRSPTAQEVADDLVRLGIPLEADTVRKYLKEAAELLLPPETEQNS